MATLQELEIALVNADRAGDMDAARKLAAVIFRSRGDMASQIPGLTVPETIPQAPEPTLGEQAIGAGETALAVGTGLTGGTVGMIGGTLKGLAEQILSGKFGTPEAARMVEESAMKGAQALTYAPRTQAGQEQTQAVGAVMQAALPVMPMTAELSAITSGIGPAIQSGQRGVTAALTRARGEPVAPAAVAAAPAAIAEAPAAALTTEQLTRTAKSAAEGGLGSKGAVKTLAEQALPDPQKVAAAERLGISEYVQPDHVTTNEAYRQVVAAIKSNPQSKIAIAERENLTKVAQRASDLIEEIGGTNDLSALSSTVKGSMQDTHQTMLKQADTLYKKVREAIPLKSESEVPAVEAFIANRAEELGGAQNLAPIEKRIFSKLIAPKEKGVLPTYALVDDVRKDVGAAARQAGPFKDADTGLAKKLYSLITEDQKAAATKYGVGDLYDAASGIVKQRKAFEDDLAALFGKNLDRSFVGSGDVGLPGAMRAASAGDATRLARLISAVPKEMRESVVASGIGSVFRKAATRGEMDFTGYMKWYDGLKRNRQAYSAVMSNLPLQSRKQLEALYRVSSGISESLNRRTKTGALSTIKAEMMGTDSLMESLFALAKRSGAGMAAEAVTTPLGIPGAGISAGIASALTKGKPKTLAAVDELIASQEFANLAKSPNGTPQRTAAIRKAANSPVFNRFVQAIGNPVEIGDRELWIAKAMQGQSAQQANQK